MFFFVRPVPAVFTVSSRSFVQPFVQPFVQSFGQSFGCMYWYICLHVPRIMPSDALSFSGLKYRIRGESCPGVPV